MNEINVAELRKRIDNLPRNNRGRRQYTAAVKREVVRYAKAELESGGTQSRVSREVDIHQATISEWLGNRSKQKPARKRDKAKLKPVVVDAAPKPMRAKSLTLELRGGHRVEGLELAQVATLLKELG